MPATLRELMVKGFPLIRCPPSLTTHCVCGRGYAPLSLLELKSTVCMLDAAANQDSGKVPETKMQHEAPQPWNNPKPRLANYVRSVEKRLHHMVYTEHMHHGTGHAHCLAMHAYRHLQTLTSLILTGACKSGLPPLTCEYIVAHVDILQQRQGAVKHRERTGK